MSDEFIETNILIGATVDWDGQSKSVTAYLSSQRTAPHVFVSARSVEEAKKVVRDRKQWTIRAGRIVFEEFNQRGSYVDIGDICDFVYKKLSDMDVRNRVKDHVLRYIRHNEVNFEGLVKLSKQSGFERVVEEIRTDFDNILDILNDIKYERSQYMFEIFADMPDSYSDFYKSKSIDIHANVARVLGFDGNDCKLILDAHHLSESGKANLPLLFITTDREDILSKDSQLESVVSNIEFVHPDSVT